MAGLTGEFTPGEGFGVDALACGCGRDVLAAVEGCEAMPELVVEGDDLRGAGAVVLFEQAEGFADDLAGRGVAA
jgi:hypothetical protein